MSEKEIHAKLERLFFSAGLPVSGKGFPYFSRAVCLALGEPERLQKVHEGIYSPVSEEFHTSPLAVQKSIQRVRDAIYENPRVLAYFRSFGSLAWTRQRIYPRDLIGYMGILLKNM